MTETPLPQGEGGRRPGEGDGEPTDGEELSSTTMAQAVSEKDRREH
jgi:hypothetical protein